MGFRSGRPQSSTSDHSPGHSEADSQALSDQKAVISHQQSELDSLQRRIAETEAVLAAEKESFARERAALKRTIEDLTEKLATKEKDEEELLLLLADQDLRLKELGVNDEEEYEEEAGIQ